MVLKFTVSGLRGIWNNGLNFDILSEYVKIFLSYLKFRDYGNVVGIARDTRITSPVIKDFVSSIIRGCGFDVYDFGVVTTPMLLFLVRKLKLSGGVIITASHNPPEWNALKFVDFGGTFLDEEVVSKFGEFSKMDIVDWNRVGKVKSFSEKEVLKLFCDEIENKIDVDLIRRKKFKVAFDPVNGAGSEVGKLFLEYLGCNVIPLNDDVEKFPQRETEPTEKALGELKRAVLDNKCNIGFALDPDGDRLALVSEDGGIPGEEFTLPIAELSAIKYFYNENFSKKIVINLSTSSISEWVGKKFGFEVVRTKVGEANVVKKLKEENAFIGGEGNGGVIFPYINSARDSFVGISLILYLLSKEGVNISEIIRGFPRLKMVKNKIEGTLSDGQVCDIKAKLEGRFNLVDEKNIDGRWMSFSNGWIHIRPSNTEPITRVIFEGDDEFVFTVRETLKGYGLLSK